MKRDRLRRDRDEIHNLEDLIEARKEHTSHFADDIDSFDKDVEIPDDTDVDEALTFPHPKHKHGDEIDLMETPHREDMEDDQVEWAEQEFLPSDYAEGYDQGSSPFPTDNRDELMEDRLHEVGHFGPHDMADEPEIEQMPAGFEPEADEE